MPAVVNKTGSELILDLIAQAQQFGRCDFIKSEKVTNIESNNNFFSVNQKYCCKYIIISTGIGTMKPRIPSNIDGIERKDDFIQYYYSDLSKFAGKKIVIAGGGDSAADCAISLSNIAKEISIIHRRSTMSCQAFKTEILKNADNIKLLLETQIKKIENKNIQTDKITIYELDYVIFCYGFIAEQCDFAGINLFTDNYINVDPTTMLSNTDRIFAIGDVAKYIGKHKGLLSGFYEANKAINTIKPPKYS